MGDYQEIMEGDELKLFKGGVLACRAKIHKDGDFDVLEGKDPNCRDIIREVLEKNK